jgi:hypothetical protein
MSGTTTAPDAVEHDSDFEWPPTDAERASMIPDLKEGLALIEQLDTDYEPRAVVVLMMLATALIAGLEAGFVVDDGRVAACIELPTGQVSWRMPMHISPRGDASERYARIKAYIESGDDRDGTPDVADTEEG